MVICETSSKFPKWKTLFSCILPTITENWEFTGIEDLLWVRWLTVFPTKTSALQRHNCYNPFPLGSGEWPSCSLALSLKTQGFEMKWNQSDSLCHLPISTTFFDGITNVIKYENLHNFWTLKHCNKSGITKDFIRLLQIDSSVADTNSFFGTWRKRGHILTTVGKGSHYLLIIIIITNIYYWTLLCVRHYSRNKWGTG